MKNCKKCGAALEDRRRRYCDSCYEINYWTKRHEYDLKYRNGHREQEIARKALWYKKNKERILAHQKAYRRRKKQLVELSPA